MVTEYGFDPLGAAALAVDMFRQDGGVVQFSPQFCGPFPQGLVVMERCKVCVAYGTCLLYTSPPGNDGISFYSAAFGRRNSLQEGFFDKLSAPPVRQDRRGASR